MIIWVIGWIEDTHRITVVDYCSWNCSWSMNQAFWEEALILLDLFRIRFQPINSLRFKKSKPSDIPKKPGHKPGLKVWFLYNPLALHYFMAWPGSHPDWILATRWLLVLPGTGENRVNCLCKFITTSQKENTRLPLQECTLFINSVTIFRE